ncbi:unnamed protein product [Rhizoctonia solani]|uniref:BTB domain-containing protein n=1 Tax=Rhizoctonia solani TaxID=456999 RepID=A0A8H3DW62_9AGAM|nr:unnamed protein product [Rhizoctonia solani]
MGKNKQNRGANASATTEGVPNRENDPKPDIFSGTVAGVTNDNRPRVEKGDPVRISLGGRSSSTEHIKWPDFQSGDLHVMVAETEVFRLHQEILAAHSTFFREQLQISVDKEEIVAAHRAGGDVPVVVLRDISVEAFINIISFIYPPPWKPYTRRIQPKELLQTAYTLGMPAVMQTAMETLAEEPNSTPISLFKLARQYEFVEWQHRCVRELVYRTRPLSNDEATDIGTIATAQIARLREVWRAGIFVRFESVLVESLAEPRPHRSGEDSDLIKWSRFGSEEPRPQLGRCQQAILEALKVVFNIERPKSEFERYILQPDASVMRNLAEWLRLGGLPGGIGLCRGCMESIDHAVQVYCRKDEMDVRIEREIGGGPDAFE